MRDREKYLLYVDRHEEEAIRFLQKMIEFDSSNAEQGVYGKEYDIQVWLESLLQEWGFTTHLFEPDNGKIKSYPNYNAGHQYERRPNLVATLSGKGNGRSLILNGHVDTVPVGDLGKWTYNPWSGFIADGKMYGRGTTDMKAGVAAMILAVRFLQEAGITLDGDVIIQSVVDEEGGGNGTLACVAEGYRADAAIVTEPTRLQVQPVGRGVLLLKVKVTGKTSHACYKWEGVNAIEKAAKIMQGLNELEHHWLAKRKHPLLPSPTINIGEINGGIAAPIVAGECTMKFDIKYLPIEIDQNGEERNVESESVKQEVEACLARVCAGDEWLREHPPELDWYVHVMPFHLEPKHELIECICSVTNQLLGWSKVSGLPSGADARHLQNSGEIPTVVFGPGDMRQAHTTDESIAIQEYIQAIKALGLIVYDWTSAAG